MRAAAAASTSSEVAGRRIRRLDPVRFVIIVVLLVDTTGVRSRPQRGNPSNVQLGAKVRGHKAAARH
jgi:hypothetical protein